MGAFGHAERVHRGVFADGIESARSSAGSQGRDWWGSYRSYSSKHLDKADHQLNDGTGPRAGLGTAYDQGTRDDVHADYLGADDNDRDHHDLGADDSHTRYNDLGAAAADDLGTAAEQHVRYRRNQRRWFLDHRFGK